MEEFNKIIEKIAKELNIKITLLSDNWLTVLEKDNVIKYIQGYKFSLNDHALGNIMDDKGLFYDVMKYKKYPIIEHKVIFKETKKEDILNYFKNNNQELIIKGNIGTCGKEVFLVNDEKTLFTKIEELFESQFSLSLCPYYNILHEYRVIVLKNKAKLIYGKNRPIVYGDGKKTLLDLAKEFNNEYFSNIENQNFDINYIPSLSEEVVINFQFNLSKGSIAFYEIENSLKNRLEELAINISKDINLLFGSVDIIETIDHELLVMEANSGVMMDNLIKQQENGYIKAYSIYKEAIEEMFNEK